MGLTGTLAQVAVKECPHCQKEYGKHSKKNFMRCLYTANYNLYNVVVELNELKMEKPIVVDENVNVNGQGTMHVKAPSGEDLGIKVPAGATVEMIKDKKDFKGGEVKDE